MNTRWLLWGVLVLTLTLAGCGSDALTELANSKKPDRSGPQNAEPIIPSDAVLSPEPVADATSGDTDEAPAPDDGIDDQASSSAADDEEGPKIHGPKSDRRPRVIIKFRPGVTANERSALHRKHGHTVDRTIPQLHLHAVKVPPGKTVEEVIAKYERHPLVESVEQEAFREPTGTPNDLWYTNWQQALQVIGAEQAWNVTTGSPTVSIAVLDTGLNTNHFEFIDRIARREVYGYDFADDDPDFYDTHSHGTWTGG